MMASLTLPPCPFLKSKTNYKRLPFHLKDLQEGNNIDDPDRVRVSERNPLMGQSRSRSRRASPSKSRFHSARIPACFKFCTKSSGSTLVAPVLVIVTLIAVSFYFYGVTEHLPASHSQDLESAELEKKQKSDGNDESKRYQNQNLDSNPNWIPSPSTSNNIPPTTYPTSDTGTTTTVYVEKPIMIHTEFWPKIQIMTDSKNTGYISKTISVFRNLARGLVEWTSSFGDSEEEGDKWEPSCTTPELWEFKAELNIPDLYKRIKFDTIKSNETTTVRLNQTNTSRSPGGSETTTTATTTTKAKLNPSGIPPSTGSSASSSFKSPLGKSLPTDKLKIFVVLHSHNDAGWGLTFEQYYRLRTKNILDNIVTHLSADQNLKFVWSETCFFDLWWSDIGKEKRSQVKKLVANRQLEFVGGGWVMPDEATSHYLSIVTQLIEGHQWLQQHLNYIPINGWTIDPFGLSSSSTFLQQRAGFKNTVFSRIHYKLREFLNQEKKSEFYWRQPWDARGNTDMFCYQMPYGTYDVRETCGANRTNDEESFDCLMYSSKCDLKPLKGHANRSREEEISERASILLRQYKKKSQLFHTNNLLMPIGGDFAWQQGYQWTKDIQNLRDIFNHINTHEELNTEIKFATLNEYFEATHRDLSESRFSVGTPKGWKTPVFSGDFFTYADRNQEYWSGYYSSRMFHKSSERQLMTLVRSSQLIYTLMAAEVTKANGNVEFKFLTDLLQKIVMARRTLSLFQHHDGITGTSADMVVGDYATKLFNALYDCHSVIQQCIHILQSIKFQNSIKANSTNLLKEIQSNDVFYSPIMKKARSESLWEDEVQSFYSNNNNTEEEETIVVFNPLAKPRKQLVRVRVPRFNVKVMDSDNEEVPCEIYPIFKYLDKFEEKENESLPLANVDHFELYFLAQFRQMELKTFRIVYDSRIKPKDRKQKRLSGVHVRIFNTKVTLSKQFYEIFYVAPPEWRLNGVGITSSKNKSIQISNHHFRVNFNENGTAESVKVKDVLYPLNVTFSYYKTKHYSGLYLFIPGGKDVPVELKGVEPVIIVVSGKLRSYVEVWYPTVRHRLTLLNHDGLESYEIHVDNILDIRKKTDYELIMKISTGIKSGKEFFTDSNGFQMMRREYRDYLPIQGNYYPIASSAFIEDRDLRLTVLAAQPGGCASLAPGQLEIMLDRRIDQDDGKGVDQGGTDNLETLSSFKLILEKPSVDCKNPLNSTVVSKSSASTSLLPLPLLSFDANLQQLNFLHPLLGYRKDVNDGTSKRNQTLLDYSIGIKPMPCDIHLMGAMPLPSFSDSDGKGDIGVFFTTSSQSALLFHRMGIDGRFSSSSKQLLEQCVIASDSTNELTVSKSSNQNPFSFGQLRVKDVFGDLFKDQMLRTSLSLSRKHKYYDGSETLGLETMEIYPFVVDYNAGGSLEGEDISEKAKTKTHIRFNGTMPVSSKLYDDDWYALS